VQELGEGVVGFERGSRVAFASSITGAYAEHVLVDASKAVQVPDEVDSAIVAASFLKGLTARYLCKETFLVKQGTKALVYAAAGGTGQILTQWIKHLGYLNQNQSCF
jgi:NADPH2:quinone reductase